MSSRWAVALLAWAAVAPSVGAQRSVAALDRRITIHVKDVSLRDALDRVAAAGGFRLSYSSDNLPMDRRVTVWRDTTLVRDIMDGLLRPFPVIAVATQDDQVVLAPRAPEPRDTSDAPVTILDRVVVTGSVIGAPERALPIALDVVRGRDIERRGQSTLSAVFDGSVPGVWLWEQAPTTMLAHYGSIRGASSFGASYPKVYIDGIEVANPLLLTQLTPERVERVEVIRGPQGGALYGSDAISGVVNIISRQDAGSGAGTRMLLRSEGGYSAGYATTAVQRHALSARFGSNLRSVGASVGYSTSGAFVPGAYSRELRATSSARFVGAKSTLTSNLQLSGKDAGVPVSPLLGALNRFRKDSLPQSLRMYTWGATATHARNEIWTYALTGGVDGYRLDNVASETGAIAFFVDSALRASQGSALRATLRANAVARFGSSDRAATLTVTAERSALHDRTLRDAKPAGVAGTAADPGGYVSDWSTNMGFTQQADFALKNTAYVTAGIRQERVLAPSGESLFRLLPMFGGALVRDFSGVTAKTRLAYGKGIRLPSSAQRVLGPARKRVANPLLAPEEQSGVESGVDLMFGERAGLHVTRFDQLASGLIQDVNVGRDTSSKGPGSAHYWYQLQNIGEIANKGWEGQANASFGQVSLGGALTTVSSRVRRLAIGYGGDLRVGDRMIGVPARTLTGSASWARGGFQVSTTLSRATNWVNYDRLAIARCLIDEMAHKADTTKVGCGDALTLNSGATLRKYWATYNGNSRLRASTAFDLGRGVLMTFTGENLLNNQRGEPDSITIVPGRTITAGLRVRF